MNFQSIKVLQKIKDLYELPRTKERFDKYLFLLQGAAKKDMILPIAAFNPMGKELAMEKLNNLITLGAEEILEEIIDEFNIKYLTEDKEDNPCIGVAINLIDDVEGAWSNFYSTDYKSKFDFEYLLIRRFCTPIFWTSECVTEAIIRQRIKAYIYRSLYWLEKGPSQTLSQLLEQEVHIQMNFKQQESKLSQTNIIFLEDYVNQHGSATDYAIIFNFFYGDEASKSLNYTSYGIIKNGGFELAKHVVHQQQSKNDFQKSFIED